jgi:hemerythrin-like domain-containing protein
MKPSDVRVRILAEHTRLRSMIADLNLIVSRVTRGKPDDISRLFNFSNQLRKTLEGHMALEEQWLVPALHKTSWGDIRAKRIVEDHENQRAALEVLAALEQSGNVAELNQGLLSLGNLLLEDMHHEEEECLQPDLLRDDENVLIDQQTE